VGVLAVVEGSALAVLDSYCREGGDGCGGAGWSASAWLRQHWPGSSIWVAENLRHLGSVRSSRGWGEVDKHRPGLLRHDGRLILGFKVGEIVRGRMAT